MDCFDNVVEACAEHPTKHETGLKATECALRCIILSGMRLPGTGIEGMSCDRVEIPDVDMKW